ncbi:MAG TPA: Tex family protein [Paenalcaligenes sp.]|nr:Tex family protein [Paenalcaligenes sp.]
MNTPNVASLAYVPDAQRIGAQLAQELNIAPRYVEATVRLLDDGATVPFIARYRKELTGGLTDEQLRDLELRLGYLRELEDRRKAIIDSIKEQDKLTVALFDTIMAADTKQRLEDLYAPYRPKRRTRAQIAIEAGLQPLADTLLDEVHAEPEQVAEQFLRDKPFDSIKAVLDGARDILAERFAEDADLRAQLRDYLWQHGWLYAQVVEGKEQEGRNFRDWFDFSEPVKSIPSHRLLAILRGRSQDILRLRLGLEPEKEQQDPYPTVQQIAQFLRLRINLKAPASPREQWLAETCRWTWRVRMLPTFETEIVGSLREQAEQEAIRVFAENLRDLLLAAPAGFKNVLGLDPGIRTGVKVAAIDSTARVVATDTIYPFAPRNDKQGSLHTLARLIQDHQIELVAIGNGTASRETEQLIRTLKEKHPELKFDSITISEAGASVYSASELASHELPDLDVSLRGAVSIARRLQDPLAELVKIEPKAIGVGQYQHDVNQRALGQSLEAVVEDCVNAVGVEVNTASAALLSHVSGLSNTLAQNIVQWREQHGAFPNRQALLEVPRFGPKTFEQAAGFLRISGGDNPLDASAVHPEAYPVVERILERLNTPAAEVVGKSSALGALQPEDFTDERFGLPTVKDIFVELERPGRDPRPEFKTAQFKEGITSIRDLTEGMRLEGVITNVANFGAFVDIGVGQDGLVHISELSNQFVRDPREHVRVGQAVNVHVLEVDMDRQRISLSMRGPAQSKAKSRPAPATTRNKNKQPARQKAAKRPQGAMAEAFARLKKNS